MSLIQTVEYCGRQYIVELEHGTWNVERVRLETIKHNPNGTTTPHRRVIYAGIEKSQGKIRGGKTKMIAHLGRLAQYKAEHAGLIQRLEREDEQARAGA